MVPVTPPGRRAARAEDGPARGDGLVGLGLVVARQRVADARGGRRGRPPWPGRASATDDQLAVRVGHGERRVAVAEVGDELQVVADVVEVVPDALREPGDEFLDGHRGQYTRAGRGGAAARRGRYGARRGRRRGRKAPARAPSAATIAAV